jgi:hypothetical protein
MPEMTGLMLHWPPRVWCTACEVEHGPGAHIVGPMIADRVRTPKEMHSRVVKLLNEMVERRQIRGGNKIELPGLLAALAVIQNMSIPGWRDGSAS